MAMDKETFIQKFVLGQLKHSTFTEYGIHGDDDQGIVDQETIELAIDAACVAYKGIKNVSGS